MKNFIILILLIVISACNCETVYEEGTSGGSVLFSGSRRSTRLFEAHSQTTVVRFPRDGEEYKEPIGFVKIDNVLDSMYSTATIIAGGVKSRFVEIEFYAPPFRGYSYKVEIRAAAN